MTLHTCKISRKGKGATGTIEVNTFGIPVVPKKGDTSITKKWKYDEVVKDIKFRDLVDKVEEISKFNQELLKKALLLGVDTLLKSASLKAQSEKAGLVRFILANDLAMDLKSAENLASVWQQTQSFMKRSMMAVPTIEDLSAQRKLYVDDQKEKGLWKTNLVDPKDLVEEKDEEEEDSEEDAE